MPSDIPFVWPAAGAMQVTSLPSGGCNIKITFVESAIVRSTAAGRILKLRSIPTKRIAKQYEILIRHEHGFESSYSIVDQTPNPGGEAHLRAQGSLVEDGGKLYEVRNGGFLHFQLFSEGKLVDPRKHIRDAFQGTIVSVREPRTS